MEGLLAREVACMQLCLNFSSRQAVNGSLQVLEKISFYVPEHEDSDFGQ